MLYPDTKRVKELRAQDPHGRSPTHALERQALIEKLHEEITKEPMGDLREILETIVDLL